MSNNNEYMNEAEKAAEIVETGIANRNFTEINQQLEELAKSENVRTQYVFEHHEKCPLIITIVVCGILAFGFLYFILIGMGTLFFSREFLAHSIIAVTVSLGLLMFNARIIYKCVALLKFYTRYKVYSDVLRYKNIELLDDLAMYSKIALQQVIKDLGEAVKLKFIPQGHFGSDNIIFIVSDEIFEKYQEKQAVYDRYYRQQLEERARISDRTDDIQAILDLGQSYVEKIHASNDIIKDKSISLKLDQMEKIVRMIFLEVDNSPQHASKLGMFLNYYLPTTDKLLEAYINADEKPIEGESISNVKSEIESSLDKINTSYEEILNKFYQEQELDIVSDISALEIMMEQESREI